MVSYIELKRKKYIPDIEAEHVKPSIVRICLVIAGKHVMFSKEMSCAWM
jgi:hypothetical protein